MRDFVHGYYPIIACKAIYRYSDLDYEYKAIRN